MKSHYRKHPSGNPTLAVIGYDVKDQRRIQPVGPEEARRILREELPGRIEQLRQELQNVKEYCAAVRMAGVGGTEKIRPPEGTRVRANNLSG